MKKLEISCLIVHKVGNLGEVSDEGYSVYKVKPISYSPISLLLPSAYEYNVYRYNKVLSKKAYNQRIPSEESLYKLQSFLNTKKKVILLYEDSSRGKYFEELVKKKLNKYFKEKTK